MSTSTAPIPIIASTVEEDSQQTFYINLEGLEEILGQPKYADKKVCVVSVAGAFRTGKSFILNFFLRYLKWQTRPSDNEAGGDSDWLVADARLEGFSWRGGDDRDTDGILVWPEPFLLENQFGEEVVVILMDTQGIFDNVSTVKSCATIFALSTLISSVQVYNINRTIQEDHLQHLELFTEYARLAMDEYKEATPFQTLFFLIRDWSVPYEAEYGLNGGQRILEKRLEVTPKQHKELQQLRQNIKSSFASLRCFLMPHPGLEVAISQDFRGELNRISAEFKAQLHALVPHLFDRNNLVVKAINGQQVTCRELLIYIKAYFNVFKGTELPEPKTILNATAEANNMAAVANAKAIYMEKMEEICGGDTPFMSSADLRLEHERSMANAVQSFNETKKMGRSEYAEQFCAILEHDIHTAFDSFVKMNNSKNLFKSVKTPAVLVTLMVINYFFQEVLQFLGLDMLASVFSLVLIIVIVLLGTWTYSRYSGNLRESAKWIDGLVNFVHSNFIAPTFTNAAINYMGNATMPILSPASSGSNVDDKKRD